MSNTVRLILVGVLLISAFFGKNIIDIVSNIDINIPTPTPTVVIDEPSIQNKTLVKSIGELVTDKDDRVQLCDFFAQLASIVENEPKLLKTTGQFREYNALSGQLTLAGLNMKDKYDTLGEKIDKAIDASIGLKNAPLDDEENRRDKLVDILYAIAWSMK